MVTQEQTLCGQLAQAKTQALHLRQHQMSGEVRRQLQRGQGMVADSKMAPPFFSEAEAGNENRDPSQGRDPVHMLACLHAAEAQSPSRADAARPRTDDHRLRADEFPAGGQG